MIFYTSKYNLVQFQMYLGDVTDSKTALNSDGTKFWSWPKLEPSPVAWDWSPDSQHTQTVLQLAALFAEIIGMDERYTYVL